MHRKYHADRHCALSGKESEERNLNLKAWRFLVAGRIFGREFSVDLLKSTSPSSTRSRLKCGPSLESKYSIG